MKRNQFVSTVIILGMLLLSFNSCKKEIKSPLPELVPSSSFVMDYSFANGDTTTTSRGIAGDTTHGNWGRSALGIFAWNVVLTLNLAVPVATFQESFNHEAEYHSYNNDWVWTYTKRVFLANYTAELHGKVIGDKINWSMYISKENEYSDFLWYTGESNLDGSGGHWILKQSQVIDSDYLRIDWTKTGTEIATIKYTNIITNHAEYGGYIEYGINADTDYNAYYDIYAKSIDNLTSIKWHRTNKYGRVSDPAFYGDEDWRCWNTLLEDSDCN